MAFLFNNPLFFNLRAGTALDPFISKSDSRLIVNNTIVLTELPYDFVGVTITLTGTAQASTATTITLASSASAVDTRYNTFNITITSGTGSGQTKSITGYVGATKVATLNTSWTINPDVTSIYSIACYSESKTNGSLSSNTFYVDYLNGIVSFNASENTQTVLASYQGRGVIQIPAQRIYTQTDANNNITQTLQDAVNSENTRLSSEIIRNGNETTRQANNTAFKLIEVYDLTHSYLPLNKVTYQGSTYQCILACLNVLPTNVTNWILIALAGSGTNVTNSTINGNVKINGTETTVFNEIYQISPMFPQNSLIRLDGLTIGNFTLTAIPIQLGTVTLA